MHAIVEFEDGSIELVPKSWLSGKRCFWPPSTVNITKISQYVKKMLPPQSGWTLYPVRVLAEAENYELGRKKSSDIFELSLDPDSYGRGTRKRKVNEDEDFNANNLGSSAESSENSSSSLDMYPPPKRRDTEKNSIISSKDIEIESSLFDSEDDSQDSLVSQLSSKVQAQNPSSHVQSSDSQNHCSQFSQAAPKACEKGTHLDDHSSSFPSSCNQLSILAYGSVDSSSCLDSHSKPSMPEKRDFQDSDLCEMILKELQLIKQRQVQHEKLLHQILEKMDSGKSASNSMPNKTFVQKLPVDNYSDMQKLDSSLSNKDQKAELTIRLQSLGGNGYKDHTRRALRHIMSDNVAEMYTWVGSRDKHKFCATIVCDVIIDAVADEKTTTRNTVEDVIKAWLRHAKDRNTHAAKNGK